MENKIETIKHLYRYRHGYKFAWIVLAIWYVWLLIESVKNIKYIFLPNLPSELKGLLTILWIVCIVATYFVVYTGVWIILIEEIYKKNIGGKRNDRRK